MKKILAQLCIVFLIHTGNLYAQFSVGGDLNNVSLTLSGTVQTLNEIDVKGTPYFGDRLHKGIVHLPGKKTTEVLNIALDLEKNQLIFQEDGVFKIFNPDIIKGIAFKDDFGKTNDFFLTGFSSPKHNIDTNTPLRIIYNGDVQLFASYSVKFDRGNFRDPVTNKTTAKYRKTVSYYFRDSNGNFTKTKLKMKDLLKAIGEHESEIKSFAKRNKIKGKSESDAFKLLEFYDTLVKDNS